MTKKRQGQKKNLHKEAEADHPESERMGMGTVLVAIFMLSCLTLLANTLWPFLPEWGTCILGTFVMIVFFSILLVNKVMDFLGLFTGFRR